MAFFPLLEPSVTNLARVLRGHGARRRRGNRCTIKKVSTTPILLANPSFRKNGFSPRDTANIMQQPPLPLRLLPSSTSSRLLVGCCLPRTLLGLRLSCSMQVRGMHAISILSGSEKKSTINRYCWREVCYIAIQGGSSSSAPRGDRQRRRDRPAVAGSHKDFSSMIVLPI